MISRRLSTSTNRIVQTIAHFLVAAFLQAALTGCNREKPDSEANLKRWRLVGRALEVENSIWHLNFASPETLAVKIHPLDREAADQVINIAFSREEHYAVQIGYWGVPKQMSKASDLEDLAACEQALVTLIANRKKIELLLKTNHLVEFGEARKSYEELYLNRIIQTKAGSKPSRFKEVVGGMLKRAAGLRNDEAYAKYKELGGTTSETRQEEILDWALTLVCETGKTETLKHYKYNKWQEQTFPGFKPSVADSGPVAIPFDFYRHMTHSWDLGPIDNPKLPGQP